MDVVYILGHQDEYEELRYSLRSLTNFPHDQVWIVGAPPPAWARNVQHLPVRQEELDRTTTAWWGRRKTNMRRNILAALDHPDVSKPFLYMNDDFLIVHECDGKKLPPLPHLGTIAETYRRRINESGAYQDTYRWLQTQGVADPFHVSEHIPLIVDERLAGWMRDCWHIVGFPVASVWGNLAGVDLADRADVDWILRHEHEQSESWPEHWWSVSTVSRSFHDWPVGARLRALFPDPSPYEEVSG